MIWKLKILEKLYIKSCNKKCDYLTFIAYIFPTIKTETFS